ncbi:hypothetical protein [Aneurinibacillus tyrosinisolvens]|uniref:hypothetical protein n=1 Tax=Aneurinibacillus tyrosinisolvens TaxID=1443435 RepID=UPI00063F3182|nr:hypothetical protein [Aneurinibacillus tyrosinisolvens]
MQYKMKVKEVDKGTDYPLLVLSGLTGLGQDTIRNLAQQGNFSIHEKEGTQTISGKEFMQWADSVSHTIEVEKTEYKTMKVNER